MEGMHKNLRNMLGQDDTQVVAVCDVFKSRCAQAKGVVDKKYGTSDCRTYGDFREVLARKEIDAVVICTPDKDLGQCVRGNKVVQVVLTGPSRLRLVRQMLAEIRSGAYADKLAHETRNGWFQAERERLAREVAHDVEREARARVGIREDGVRLADLLEVLLGNGIAGGDVGVVGKTHPYLGRFSFTRDVPIRTGCSPSRWTAT